ncbi:MAG: ACT domain-containing protein [Candidatus Brocadiae bacterium]|nr:ACT domain-containing protein [Candidatus Brocadiia bacterium]
MALTVTRVKVWAAAIQDKPGRLAEKLGALADAGANLEFVIARREAAKPGTGVVFITPLKGAKQHAAARKAGFKETKSLHSLRVEGADKPGIGARITAALAEADINLRGLSAAAIGKKFILHLAVDKATDTAKAMKVLKALK